MELLQKLNTINIPKITPLQDGTASTIEDFWNSFIVHTLPDKAVALKWHRVLMEYIKQPDAMFAIRGYNSASKENYDSLRRGFLTRTNAGYSFFYTDNFHAAYYLKMAIDGYVPSVEEMIELYNARKFPARFGRDTSNERAMMAIPRGKDPGIQTAGYKIAHVLNVGKDYFIQGENISLLKIIKRYFNGGHRNDWTLHIDRTGSHYLRELDVDPCAKRYLIAQFLRFVHPFNYFLTPKRTCSLSPVCKDIAEYQPLVDYVQSKFSDLYGSAYDEFLESVMPVPSPVGHANGNTIIDLKYGLNGFETSVSQKRAVRPAISHPEIPTQIPADALSELKVGKIAQTYLRKALEEGKADDEEVGLMRTKEYSKQRFGIDFPLLVSVNDDFDTVRYYSKPLSIRGLEYRLCSQWYEVSTNNDRLFLLSWLEERGCI